MQHSKVAYSAVDSKAEVAVEGASPPWRRCRFARWKVVVACLVAVCCACVLVLVIFLVGSSEREPPQAAVAAQSGANDSIDAVQFETSGRLPSDVIPLHYNITIFPEVYYNRNVSSGSVSIVAKALNATDTVQLHMTAHINGSKWSVFSQRTQFNIQSVLVNDTFDIVQLTLEPEISEGEIFTIRLSDYLIETSNDMQGLYWSSYVENGVTKYIVSTQMQPTYARSCFPCFDEPAMKATFSVSVVRRSDFIALGNMPSVRNTTVPAPDLVRHIEGDAHRWIREDFATTLKMPTYLVALVVAQFDGRRNFDEAGRRFRIWTRPKEVNATQYAFDLVLNITSTLEDYLSVPYLMNKTDQVAIPEFASGAMENWGLITYREYFLLYNKYTDPVDNKRQVAVTVAHEISHNWFGNLVTLDWWDHTWLNEGFASYMEVVGLSNQPEWDADVTISYLCESARSFDQMQTSAPMSSPVVAEREIEAKFNIISYTKAACMVRQTCECLGVDVFRKAMTSYLRNLSYSSAVPQQLYSHLNAEAEAANKTLVATQAMIGLVEQAGFPVINCSVAHNELTLKQERYFSYSATDRHPPSEAVWTLPITMATSANISQWKGTSISHLVQWMGQRSQKFRIEGSPKFYVLNLKAVGFFRVNYDLDNWWRLIDQLNEDPTVFTAHTRSQLIADSFELASSGRLPYSVPLSMLKYLKNETHPTPWEIAYKKLTLLEMSLQWDGGLHALLTSYTHAILRESVDWETFVRKRTTDDDLVLERSKRKILMEMACDFRLPACLEHARSEFWKFNNTGDILQVEPDIRRAVLCAGMWNATQADWFRLEGLIQRHEHTSIWKDILFTSVCFWNSSTTEAVLYRLLEEGRFKLYPFALEGITNKASLEALWNAVWRLEPDNLDLNFLFAFEKFGTQQQKAMVMEQKNSTKRGRHFLEIILNDITSNIEWLNANKEQLAVELNRTMVATLQN